MIDATDSPTGLDPRDRQVWLAEVESYFDRHGQRVLLVSDALRACDAVLMAAQQESNEQRLQELQQAIEALEASLAERSGLLASAPLAVRPSRLVAALDQLGASPLAQRGRYLSRQTAMVHEQALGQFLCHYQLYELTGRLSQLIASGGHPHNGSRTGGLLDSAA
jgi:hypothetical protein